MPEKHTSQQNTIYTNVMLDRKVYLSFNKIGSNVKEVIEHEIIENVEGKCDTNGFIKKIRAVLKHSLVGLLKAII